MTRPDETLSPRRRGRRTGAAPGASTPGAYDEAEIAQGSATALLGALGRMQLKLDLLARTQAETLAELEAKVDRLQQTLDELTVDDD